MLVGTETKGMLSDMYSVHLPNGLDFMLSNQRYTTPTGQALEGVDVQPDIGAENTPADQRHDPVLQKALEIFRQKIGR